MKARISLQNKIPKNQMKALREFCDQRFKEDAQGHTRRLFKIACIALNEKFGFGAERCSQFLDEAREVADKHIADEVFWTHADKRLQQMGLLFTPEDYDKIEG